MFNNNIKSNESKQIEEKLYKKNSVNMEKTNNDIKSNKNEENKNNEINLIKRNSKQLSNNQKIYGEKATIKRNKIIKKGEEDGFIIYPNPDLGIVKALKENTSRTKLLEKLPMKLEYSQTIF